MFVLPVTFSSVVYMSNLFFESVIEITPKMDHSNTLDDSGVFNDDGRSTIGELYFCVIPKMSRL